MLLPGPVQVETRTTGLQSALVLIIAAALSACVASESTSSVCDQAADVIEECTGSRPSVPGECVGEPLEAAESVVSSGCNALADERADGGGFWCAPASRWLGLCRDTLDVHEVAAITKLDQVCPAQRSDALCHALTVAAARPAADAAAAFKHALSLVAQRVKAGERSAVWRDPAVRWLLRERAVALLVWNAVTELGTQVPASGFETRARAVLATHFPLYSPQRFHLTLAGLPPAPASECDRPSILMIFPGVVRLGRRDEYHEQLSALARDVPCLRPVLVDAGTFVAPELNAQQAWNAWQALPAELRDAPVHLFGYSQGAAGALSALVRYPTLAAKVESVLVMNSAARGSELGDAVEAVLERVEAGGELCRRLPDFVRPTCDAILARSPRPDEEMRAQLANLLGLTQEELQAFIAAEDEVEPVTTLRAFYHRHRPGIRSLSTRGASEFWNNDAAALPREALYLSFRTMITRVDENLPSSNGLFYELLTRAGGQNPYNDMQVRTINQRLAGPVADIEVVSPVAEGNHWQWHLAQGAVTEPMMPAAMTAKIPHRALFVAYYQTLVEAGLL